MSSNLTTVKSWPATANLEIGAAMGLVFLAGCTGFPATPDPGGNPTEFSETIGCATSFYDAKYGYGFELPGEAAPVRTKSDASALSNSWWTLEVSGRVVNILTRVQEATADAELGNVVMLANDRSISAGADLLAEEEVALANGGTGIQTILRSDGMTIFRVQTLSRSRFYTVETLVEESTRDEALDELAKGIVLSACIDAN